MRKACRQARGIALEAARRRLYGEAQGGRRGRHRRHGVIDRGHHAAFDPVLAARHRTHEARADHARIILRHVRHEQRPRRPAAQTRRQPPALDARQRRAARVELADRDPLRERLARELLQIVQGGARLEHFHQAGRAAGDEEQGLHLGRQCVHPLQQALAGGERALIGQRVSAEQDLERAAGGELCAGRIAGDQERALDGGAERLVRAVRHGLGGLADRGQPHVPRRSGGRDGGGFGERRAHATAAVDALKPGAQQGKQQRAARVGGVGQFSSRAPL